MAEALIITRDDVVKFTSLNGNCDPEKFIQYVKIAQDIHIQKYLGTDLLEKIKADIIANTLGGNYLTLVNTYIKPLLIHWAMVEYLPYSAYTIGNKGVYKHNAESSENIDRLELSLLIDKQTQTANHYSNRFVDYMCFNQALFPEYNSNSNGDIYPSSDINFTNWVL